MTDAEFRMSEPPPPPRPPHRLTLTVDVGRPWLVVAWALFIFASGAIAGAALLFMLRPGPGFGPLPGGRVGDAALPRDFARIMQHEDGLSDEQTEAVEQIVQKYTPRFRQTSQEAREQLRTDLEKMNQEILPLLTEEQRAIHLKRWRRMIAPRDPLHRGPPPHEPPLRRPPRRNGPRRNGPRRNGPPRDRL